MSSLQQYYDDHKILSDLTGQNDQYRDERVTSFSRQIVAVKQTMFWTDT
jgi:hypothetical protein